MLAAMYNRVNENSEEEDFKTNKRFSLYSSAYRFNEPSIRRSLDCPPHCVPEPSLITVHQTNEQIKLVLFVRLRFMTNVVGNAPYIYIYI